MTEKKPKVEVVLEDIPEELWEPIQSLINEAGGLQSQIRYVERLLNKERELVALKLGVAPQDVQIQVGKYNKVVINDDDDDEEESDGSTGEDAQQPGHGDGGQSQQGADHPVG